MVEIKVADPLAQHLADAVERRVDLESWRNRERAKAMLAGDPAKLLRAELVMKRARRLQVRAGAKAPR